MANTRFKTENGLLVTGGNAQFDDIVRMNANLTVDGDLLLVTGDLQVQGAQVFTGGQLYTSDIVADVDGLNIANTTNQFNAFLGTVRVFDGLFPQGNTLPLGNNTSRFVITANTLNLSGNAAITGNLTVSNTMSVTGAVTLGNTLSVTNSVTFANTLAITGPTTLSNTIAVTGATTLSNTIAVTGAGTLSNTLAVTGAVTLGNTLSVANSVTLSNTLSVAGAITGSANVNIDSGVLFVDAVNNRVGVNNTAPAVALRVTGAADFSSTANIQGNANVGGTLGVSSSVNVGGTMGIAGNLMVTDTTRTHYISGNSSFSGGTLFINSVESRVGIGTSTPDVTLQVVGSANVTGASRFTNTVNIVGAVSLGNTLSVTNSATFSNTLSIAGAANALTTFGISGQGNALGAFGVNGLLTAAAGLTVTGITNTSSQFNVGGGVATTNGVTITTTSIAVGNSTAYTNIQPITTATFIPASSQEAQVKYANSTGTLWFYQAYSHLQDFWSLNRADGTSWLSTMLAAYRGNNSLLFNANAIAMVGNVNIDSGVLYVDALNNRVGINNTAPGVALRVTGAVDISSTANIQGNANVGGTLGAAGLITGSAGLTVTGTINASANLNVGTYATGTVNGFNVTNNALSIGNTTANALLTGSSLNVHSHFTVNGTVLTTGATTNVNIDSGTLFVDAAANRVGINNTAPGVALRVTGAADISTTANVQGNANVGGTLGVNGAATFANVIVLNDQSVLPVTAGSQIVLRAGRNYQSTAATIGGLYQFKAVNTAMTAGRGHHGFRSELMNESRNLGADGVTQYYHNYNGFSTTVFNGNSAIGGDATAYELTGFTASVANYANGALANTVQIAQAGEFLYRSYGSGVTTNAYGVNSFVGAANNSVTGNITTVYGVTSVITSNTAMTIGTGYLFYGDHNGTTTTTKYGLYLTNESNNYISGNVYVAGAVRPIGGIVANGSIGSAGQVLTSNSTGVYWGKKGSDKYVVDIGNGSATTFTITHNLNSNGVIVIVRENSTNYYVYPDIKYSTDNAVILEFVDAPTTNQYKVIAVG